MNSAFSPLFMDTKMLNKGFCPYGSFPTHGMRQKAFNMVGAHWYMFWSACDNICLLKTWGNKQFFQGCWGSSGYSPGFCKMCCFSTPFLHSQACKVNIKNVSMAPSHLFSLYNPQGDDQLRASSYYFIFFKLGIVLSF